MTTLTKPYVGVRHSGVYELFRASEGPTEELYGTLYAAVIGPFRTARGARFMRDYGRGNPHCQHVNDAERLAKKFADEEKRHNAVANEMLAAVMTDDMEHKQDCPVCDGSGQMDDGTACNH